MSAKTFCTTALSSATVDRAAEARRVAAVRVAADERTAAGNRDARDQRKRVAIEVCCCDRHVDYDEHASRGVAQHVRQHVVAAGCRQHRVGAGFIRAVAVRVDHDDRRRGDERIARALTTEAGHVRCAALDDRKPQVLRIVAVVAYVEVQRGVCAGAGRCLTRRHAHGRCALRRNQRCDGAVDDEHDRRGPRRLCEAVDLITQRGVVGNRRARGRTDRKRRCCHQPDDRGDGRDGQRTKVLHDIFSSRKGRRPLMTSSPHSCAANVSKHGARNAGTGTFGAAAGFRNTVSGGVHSSATPTAR